MIALQEFFPFLNSAIWHGFVVFCRVAALAAVLPAFGEQTLSARVKLAAALAFTVIVAPALPIIPAPGSIGAVSFVILTEVVAGLAIGIGLRLFVLALQTAGSIAAQSTSLSQVLGGAAVDPLPAMGYILVIAGLALAVMAGLHVKVAQLIILSYDFMPVGRFANAADLSEWGTSQVAHAFSLAFTLAAPFVILSVLYNFALGAINRAMPQLMVAFVGAPVITLGGLALLLISAPYMLTVWLGAMDRYLADPFGVLP
ncbi:type III secretion protein [Roseobacter denitrificans]|uniref:Flagellar biosynthetic protein FliR n=1 Tax=Roseobacter denitrificans (strain ATCC 33942 / OCh 114) TaxID=375451 RepID=Q16DQ9_ROSDO|nr:flagellar biosynthetic protein FliR [Roseobacter denitrificans]ABG29884.1 flagellar biosynthetic protein FliR [Roseobacter denitrificans OCh 114]AVL53100.1 type III secretion protein [Roseobacter denitrificans]SFG25268.1 flagellar biosynthetic protein FliR [Roseobacter denitrificans OCh 114]